MKMATAGPSPRSHDRHPRRRPFASWVKKLTKKASTDNTAPTSKKNALDSPSKSKKYGSLKNNPYPESGCLNRQSIASSANGQLSMTATSNARNSFTTEDGVGEERKPPVSSNRSAAPTVATNNGTIHSDAGQSKAGTSNTVGGGLSSNEGAGNSTFSSPNHSERSLTTTLTTIQSTAPSTMLGGPPAAGANPPATTHAPHTPTVQFSHQFPSTSPPPSAIPHHLAAPHGHPSTYTTATANNLLTDNASIITLASSSHHHHRRHSLDTDASVRALAPSSVWGGSRESLPLSVLSANVGDAHDGSARPRPSVVGGSGFASTERASVYSSSGVAPAGGGGTGKQQGAGHDGGSVRSGLLGQTGGGDGGSVRSGLLGHGRNDSITGSIGGLQGGGGGLSVQTSPLASPREGRMGLSRRSSDWKADAGELSDGDEGDDHQAGEVMVKEKSVGVGEDGNVGVLDERSKTQDDSEGLRDGVGGDDHAKANGVSDHADQKAKENDKPA